MYSIPFALRAQSDELRGEFSKRQSPLVLEATETFGRPLETPLVRGTAQTVPRRPPGDLPARFAGGPGMDMIKKRYPLSTLSTIPVWYVRRLLKAVVR
jgi:hypothetical protein